ncbi:MAG: SMR family transporter [Eubacteriales bacterium]|nr:SMR family transporter [Eubacteriales bacterium]
MKYYIYLAAAIAAEIMGTACLKYSDGLTKFLPSAFSMIIYLGCHISFGKAITHIHLGIGYAVWCGVGIVATTAISVGIFHEKITFLQGSGILLILAGCILLNLQGK